MTCWYDRHTKKPRIEIYFGLLHFKWSNETSWHIPRCMHLTFRCGNINFNTQICFMLLKKAWIAQRYSAGLRAGWSRVWFPEGAGNVSLHHRVQTGSGAHPASYPMSTKGSFPQCKAAGGVKLTTHLHLVPRPRMCGPIPPLLQYASMAWYSFKIAGKTLRLPYN
jgi:hypothetical protein